MAREDVISYQFIYRIKEQKVRLHLTTKQSGQYKEPVDVLPLEKAVFLMDMLRNEKPIYYNPETSVIYTNEEPVGEKE